MDYERMWNILKDNLKMNLQLSDYININKLIEEMRILEEKEKNTILGFKDGTLPF